MMQSIEHAAGSIKRVVAFRLKPGMDVLKGIAAAGMICHDDDGNLLLHVHMSMSDQHGTGHGGHLIEGTKVLLTTDMVIAELDGLVMGRRFDEELGVPLFAPKQK